MSAEEIITIAIGKLVNWIVILITGYFWLVINHVKKDIDNVAQYARDTRAQVDKLDEILVCLQVKVGKIQQQIDDNKETCERRHRNE